MMRVSYVRTTALANCRFNNFKVERKFIHVEARIEALGYKLSERVYPKGNYVPYVISKGQVFLAGHLPITPPPEGKLITGRLGQDMTLEQGQVAAQLATLQLLSTLKLALGDLDRVRRIVKIYGVVNSTLDFTRQAEVMNGCSDLLGEVFGVEKGSHARTSIGTSVMPLGVPVEIDAVVEFDEFL